MNIPNINMLFYSNHCGACRNVMTLLHNEGLRDSFKLVCVDGMLDKFPKDMRVPLMRLKDVVKPLHVQDIFDWISSVKFMRQQPQRQVIQQQPIQQKNDKNLIGYDAEIMSKISDGFALADEKINDPLPQSYVGIGQEANNMIFTPPKEQQKMDKCIHSKIMCDIEEKRYHQDEAFAQHAKQIQQDLLSNAEHNGYVFSQPSKTQPKRGMTVIKRK